MSVEQTTISLKQRDTYRWETTLTDPETGEPYDLSDANEVRLYVEHGRSEDLVVDAPVEILDPENGEVAYDLSRSETARSGTHRAEFEIDESSEGDDDYTTVPDDGYVRIDVTRMLNRNVDAEPVEIRGSWEVTRVTATESVRSPAGRFAEQLGVPVYAADEDAPRETGYFNETDGQLKYKDRGGGVHAGDGGLLAGEDFDGQGTSSFQNLDSVGVDDLNNRPQVPDTTADAQEFQSKLDSLDAERGGPEELGPGRYTGLSTVSLGQRQQLWGAGIESTVLELGDGVDANLIEYVGDGDRLFFSGLKDLKLLGNKENNASGHGLYLDDMNDGAANDFHLAHVFIHAFAGDGIHSESTWGDNFYDFLVETCDGDGVVLSNGSQYDLVGGFVAYNAGAGLNISARRGHIANVETRSNDGHGARISNTGNQLDTVHAYNNGLHGFTIDGNNCSLTNVRARNNGQGDSGYAGVSIGGDDVVLTGGMIYDDQSTTTQFYGLYITGSNILVSNVSIWGNESTDLQIGGSATEAVLSNVSYGTLTDNGTRTIINGRATNIGDPSSTGQWNGHADRAYDYDATVWDTSTSPSTPYKSDDDGNWVAI